MSRLFIIVLLCLSCTNVLTIPFSKTQVPLVTSGCDPAGDGFCSSNVDCKCLQMVTGAHICAISAISCSKLVSCDSNNMTCPTLNTGCVTNTRCQRPVCYPVEAANPDVCPPMTSLTTTTRSPEDNKYLKWKQQATTVAGGNGDGYRLDQLSQPFGISVDHNKNILIVDRNNNRIVRWEWQAKNGTIIAGGKGHGNQMDQLDWPTDLIVDKKNHSMIVADYSNSRVMRWIDQNQSNPQILIDKINCYGLAMDKEGYLYVSGADTNEVRRWKEGERRGTVVAGGNGKGDQLNQLNYPTYLFVDDEQSVYVSDWENHRVMKWRKDAKEGEIVAGGNGKGNSLNQLYYPYGVIVDRWGQIYVADYANGRVMRWREGEREGEIIVGGNSEEQQSNQVPFPNGLSFDDEGNLYVADDWFHRIQKFDLILS